MRHSSSLASCIVRRRVRAQHRHHFPFFCECGELPSSRRAGGRREKKRKKSYAHSMSEPEPAPAPRRAPAPGVRIFKHIWHLYLFVCLNYMCRWSTYGVRVRTYLCLYFEFWGVFFF